MDATKWRISKACQTCRIKKIKCNGKTPCENCQTRSLQCLYREKARNRTRKIKERTAVDEKNTSHGDGETPPFQPYDEGLNTTTTAPVTASDSSSAASPAQGFHGERSINNSSVAATHRASPSSCLLQLYYGPSSNFSLMNAIYHQIEGTRPNVSSREAVEEVGPGLDLFSHRRLFFGDSADNRPSSASFFSDDGSVIALDHGTASRLLDRYLLTYWHGAPVLSKATYRRRLDRLFKPPSILNFDSPDTIIVILAVALGASMTGEEAIAQFLFGKAKQGIAKLDEVVNAQVVQIHLMMMSLPTHHPFAEESERARPNSSFLHVGNAVRKAVAVGLHKNAYTQPWQTPEDVEQRRILFWSLFFWETWNCFVVGRPSSIPDPGQSVPIPKDQKLLMSLVTLARIMDKCAKRIYSPRHDSLLPVWNAAMEIRRELHQFAEQQLKDMKFGLVGDPSTGELGLCQAIVSTMYHHTLLLTFRPFLILRAKLRREKPSSSDATTSAAEGLQAPPPWLDDACEYCLEAARNSIGFLAGSCATNILCRELHYHGFFIEGSCYALAFDMLQEKTSAHRNLPGIQSGLRCLRSMLRDAGTHAGANASQLPTTIASIEQMVRSVFPNLDLRDPKVDPDIRQLRSHHQQPVHSTTVPGSPSAIPVGDAVGEECLFTFPSMPFGFDVSQPPDGTYPWGTASEELADFTAADFGWDIDFGTMNMEAFLSLDPNEAFNFTSVWNVGNTDIRLYTGVSAVEACETVSNAKCSTDGEFIEAWPGKASLTKGKPHRLLSSSTGIMAHASTDEGVRAETPNRSFVSNGDAHFGSSSETDVDLDNIDEESGKAHIQKRLSLTFQNVTVRVTAPDEALGETLWSRIDPRQLGGIFSTTRRPKRTILNDVSGQVNPGEMLLVLGRPGSGCTSLLRVLSNQRGAFQEVTGETHYGSMNHVDARKIRQQIVLNTEDDIHFPTLTVNQTMKFALRNKVPEERPEGAEKKYHFVRDMRDDILDSLQISHTQKTLVGNEFIRGVSGGERKRVSLAEVLASQSPLQFWDQPTRGLDSKTALKFVETLRQNADRNSKSVVLTTYQAGNGIFDAFDKVLVLAEGRVIYYGLRAAAQSYFEDMGFICPRGANVADFLTSVTVETERAIAPGFEDHVPTTSEEFEDFYKSSETCRQMSQLLLPPQSLADQVEDLKIAVQREKRQRKWKGSNRSIYTAGLREQVVNCTRRQWQIMMGDRLTLAIKIVSATIQGLVCGSLFYNLPLTSESVFLRPGVLIFPVLYFLLESMSETTASFMGRPILARHKRFGFYRPTAFCIANALTDIPIVLMQVTCFSLIIYFMSGLQMDAGKFFTFWIVTNANTLCFVQMFRAIGAMFNHFGLASYISGLLSTIFFVYAGYLIPFDSMRVWFRWIFYLNPGAYAFESLMANEFQGLQLDCVAPQQVPFGGAYDDQDQAYRGCTVLGSDGSGTIDGVAYLREQYGFSVGHIWRGFGVIIGFWIFFISLTALGFELKNSHGGSSVLLFKRAWRSKKRAEKCLDAEKGAGGKTEPSTLQLSSQSTRQSTFSWSNLDYFVQYQGARKQLLSQVFGYVKPGNLVALMGCSGAGKTTLLDVLAQRKDAGEIKGSILIDGKPQGISFQRMTGYCEQMDVHEATATVKEALIFSAVLRQPQHVPYQEKVAYVDHIIQLLELEDLCDALIGTPGAGLTIEQRKRVTLGVELVAKPTLLFLDEPTSGLDGQSAYNIVRFMRRLVDGGQAVLCTIHQPSAVLFDAFDSLLLLAKGGRMAYFGETGQSSQILLDYFARNGAPCPEGANPAEHMVEVIQGNSETNVDWVDVWNHSPERERALQTLEQLNEKALANTQGMPEDTADFATSKWFQWKTVLHRQMVQLWRSPDYVWNKINLHVFAALFSGFTFWKIGNGTFDLQLRLFAIFNFIFVAPGCINQMQPYFLHNRDLFETREKKAKMYHWSAFIASQTVAEIPYLIICATLYFACWYFTVGFPVEARISGHVYLQMIFYEFLYTSIGQAIAAYAPNEYFAAVMNPLLIGAGMISFAGVVVPYDAMQPFWRYWLYYLNPFHYLFGGLMAPVVWNVEVECLPNELTSFGVPDGQTCGEYMADFLSSNAGYVDNPDSTDSCSYCAYSTGAEYAQGFNINEEYYGWRDTGITALFCISSYALVFLMMKLRSKKTKSARSE